MGSPLDIHLAHINQEENTRNRLKETPPEAFDKLIDCPCTEDEIKADADFEESNTLLKTFHRGAESGYRSVKPVEYKAPNGEIKHLGQQCTFSDNALITHGEGAGSGDAISPNHSTLRHFDEDVIPALQLSHEEYKEYRPINNGNNCKPNPPIEKDLDENQLPVEKTIEEPTPSEQLESILTDENNAGDELESIISEESSLGETGEAFTESATPETESLSEMNMGGL